MNKKYPWLPVDERLLPDVVSFKYPKSRWVRWALALEITCAVLALVGTMVIVLLPRSYSTTPVTTSATDSANPQK